MCVCVCVRVEDEREASIPPKLAATLCLPFSMLFYLAHPRWEHLGASLWSPTWVIQVGSKPLNSFKSASVTYKALPLET